MRTLLAESLDDEGIERFEQDPAGVLIAAPEMPAIRLRWVGSHSRLGENLRDMTIAGVAGMRREAFIDTALQGVTGLTARQRRADERRASEVWAHATRVVNLSRAWHGE